MYEDFDLVMDALDNFEEWYLAYEDDLYYSEIDDSDYFLEFDEDGNPLS